MIINASDAFSLLILIHYPIMWLSYEGDKYTCFGKCVIIFVISLRLNLEKIDDAV